MSYTCTGQTQQRLRKLNYNINYCSDPRLVPECCMQRRNPNSIVKALKAELTLELPPIKGKIDGIAV